MATSVPVYILTGFLGAGKTTLLQTLLQHSKSLGQSPVVLMNEFGNESVDSVLLQQAAVPVVDIVEGCVCCTVRDSLTLALLQMVERYQPDVLFLEATGVAMPLEIVDVLFHDELQERVHLAGVLTLVDATNFPLQSMPGMESAIQRTMLEQVRHADAILLSKTDLTKFDRLIALESFLSELNPDAPQIKVVKGQVDATLLLGIRTLHGKGSHTKRPARIKKWTKAATVGNRVHPLKEASRTSFGTLQTLHYPFRAPVDTDRFYEFLRSLPPTIYRGKGFYRDAEGGYCYEFHYTPNFPMIDPRPDLADQPSFAIFIGEKLEEQAIRQKLAACEVRS